MGRMDLSMLDYTSLATTQHDSSYLYIPVVPGTATSVCPGVAGTRRVVLLRGGSECIVHCSYQT